MTYFDYGYFKYINKTSKKNKKIIDPTKLRKQLILFNINYYFLNNFQMM